MSFFTTPEDLAKRITQDLPPVLERIGVHLEPEPRQIIQQDAKEVLKRFRARPTKYAGREITVRCRVTGEVRSVAEDNCLALRLPPGDAIERKFEPLEEDSRISYMIATKQIGDWLEELPMGSEVTVKIKLLSGTRTSLDMAEGEPAWTTRLVRGYQITDIIEDINRSSQIN